MAVVVPIRGSAWQRVRERFWAALVVTFGAFVAVQAELIEKRAWKVALVGVIALWWVRILNSAWGTSHLGRFWIRIEPNWAAIGRDYAIDPEDVRGLSADDEALAKRYAAVERITFTVLEPNLAFRHDHQTFFSETDIEENMPGWEARHRRRMDRWLKKDQPHDPPTNYVESVYVYIYSRAILEPKRRRRQDAGYELGITTEASQAKSHVGDDYDREGARVHLATLPYLALASYWDGEDDMFSQDRRREIKAALERHGWTEEERRPGDPIDWPTRLKHKYFTVYHDGI